MTSLSDAVILFFSSLQSCFTRQSSDSLSVALKRSLWNTQSFTKAPNQSHVRVEFVAISCTERVQPNSTWKHVQIPAYCSESDMPAWHHPWQRCERRFPCFRSTLELKESLTVKQALPYGYSLSFVEGTKYIKIWSISAKKIRSSLWKLSWAWWII